MRSIHPRKSFHATCDGGWCVMFAGKSSPTRSFFPKKPISSIKPYLRRSQTAYKHLYLRRHDRKRLRDGHSITWRAEGFAGPDESCAKRIETRSKACPGPRVVLAQARHPGVAC